MVTDKSMKIGKVLMALITVFFWLSHYGYVPYLPLYLKGLGASATLIGLVSGSYGFAQLLLRMPVGFSSDLWGRRKPYVILGTALAGLAGTLMVFAGNPYVFLIARFFAGCSAAMWVAISVLYTSYYDDDTKAIGHLEIFNHLGRLLAFLCSALFIASLGVQSSFLISAIAGFCGLALSFFVTDTKSNRRSSLREVVQVARHTNLIVAAVLATIVQIIMSGLLSTFSNTYASSIGASDTQLGLLQAAFGVMVPISSFLLAHFLRRLWGRRTILVIAFISLTVYALSYTFITSIPLLFVTQFVIGLTSGTSMPLLMALCIEDFPPEKKSSAMGIFQAIYAVGLMLGPVVAGLFVDATSLHTAFMLMAFFPLCAAVISFFYYKKNPQ